MNDGYAEDQQDFIGNVKPTNLSHLWSAATRLDPVADVGVSQARETKATVQVAIESKDEPGQRDMR